jgi:hypothetical protein
MAPTTRHRALAAMAAAATLTLLITSTALAGGWASATLDRQPADPGEGGTLVVGFTLMQHGVTPVDWGQPVVTLVNPESGARVTADAVPSGAAGHWTAELTVPSAGSWSLEIRHDLEVVPANFGSISVGGQRPAGSATAVATTGLQPALLAAIAFLGALGITVVAFWMVAWRRTRTGVAGI